MKRACKTTPSSNPFSTRFVRPGAIAYRFEPGQSAAGLVDRLAANGWRGQIVGPHGSGKSTLLATLNKPLAEVGRGSWCVGLHDGARRMPVDWLVQAQRASARLIVIDGYEQLGAVNRLRVKAHCRRHGWGLLVTAHGDVGLPTLIATAPNLEHVRAVVHQLLADQAHEGAISPAVVAECFAASGGNVRETLFALYDRWEAAHR